MKLTAAQQRVLSELDRNDFRFPSSFRSAERLQRLGLVESKLALWSRQNGTAVKPGTTRMRLAYRLTSEGEAAR